MNIATTCTDRKTMARGLAEHLGCSCEYLRTPTYSFQVGRLRVERDSSISGERDDLEAAAGWLLENGYIQEPLPAEDIPEAEQQEPEETEADTDSETISDHGVTTHCISLPLAGFTPDSLKNLIRTLYARQILIRAMLSSDRIRIEPEVITTLQSDALTEMPILERVLRESLAGGFMKGIDLDDGRLSVEFSYDKAQPTRWQHYASLLLAIDSKAKTAKRVNATLVEPADSEMKYFCRGFLLQLGLSGPQHKELRSVLLGHLHGFAAFRTAEKMDAHRQKYADLRRQMREADSEAQSEVNEHEEGYYGAKVWHSNSKYRRVIYQCNHKYHEGNSCNTPHLTEDEIKQGFVVALNRLLEGKTTVISNLESLSSVLFDTSEMETTVVKLKAEMELVQEMIQKAIAENARVALDQKEYKARFDELSQRFDTLEKQRNELERQIADRVSRRAAMHQFIGVLKKQKDLITEFDPSLWGALLDHATIYGKDDIRFTFKDGTEINAIG